MSTWRRVCASAFVAAAIGSAVVLPGCDSGGGTNTGPAPNPEVKIELPKDAQGNPIGETEGEIPN